MTDLSNMPLGGIRVIDFTQVMMGPVATQMLADYGADVIKIEKPGTGDLSRTSFPNDPAGLLGPVYCSLNRNKRSIVLDTRSPQGKSVVLKLIETADVVVNNFRAGVMDRLGFGYEALKAINPGLIYCAISGWGQTGPKAMIAAHDLNYLAESGILGLSAGADGAPVIPPVLIADLAGGAYPAVTNILLALRRRDKSGEGAYLDISMGDNLLTLAYWGLGSGFAAGEWPGGSDALVTGGSPRYQIYRTADDRYLAAAPIEEKFWDTFCATIGLAADMRGADADENQAIAAVAAIVAGKTAAEWTAIFAGKDLCCSIVASLKDAVADPHVAARGLLSRTISVDGRTIPALPVPVSDQFRGANELSPPRLGADTATILAK